MSVILQLLLFFIVIFLFFNIIILQIISVIPHKEKINPWNHTYQTQL